jgi:hypothetical protein
LTSGDEISVRIRFRTGPETYSASYKMGTGSFQGYSSQDVTLKADTYTAPMIKEEKSYASTPHL